jgi:hypothetical protein
MLGGAALREEAGSRQASSSHHLPRLIAPDHNIRHQGTCTVRLNCWCSPYGTSEGTVSTRRIFNHRPGSSRKSRGQPKTATGEHTHAPNNWISQYRITILAYDRESIQSSTACIAVCMEWHAVFGICTHNRRDDFAARRRTLPLVSIDDTALLRRYGADSSS